MLKSETKKRNGRRWLAEELKVGKVRRERVNTERRGK